MSLPAWIVSQTSAYHAQAVIQDLATANGWKYSGSTDAEGHSESYWNADRTHTLQILWERDGHVATAVLWGAREAFDHNPGYDWTRVPGPTALVTARKIIESH